MIPARAGFGPWRGHCSPCCKPRLAAVGTRQKTRSLSESHGQVLHGGAVQQLQIPPPASATAAHQHGAKLKLPSNGQTSEGNIPALPKC